jgi:pimeloyl-ACP methyl ester carboxylesterase
LSYSWRHQIPAIAAAGFHAMAPDMRGFGRTSAPAEIDAYSIFDNVGDMVALVAASGETQATIIGHDWGAPVAWHAAMFRPDIFKAVAGLSVPPPLRGRARPLDTLRESGITNFYWQYFQAPGTAEAEFERDIGLTMRTLLGRGFSDPAASLFIEQGKGFLGDARADRKLPAWLSEADLAIFTDAYKKSGFRGGLNWYRNIDRNWELTAPWHGAQIRQPSLFIAGSEDSVITGLIGAKRIGDMERVLPDLRDKLIIKGAGHWVQQERAEQVNAALIGFLKANAPGR